MPFWVKQLIDQMEDGKNYVVEGIRNPGEIEELRKLRNFVLVGVNAPIEQRLEWIKNRNKDSDPKHIEGIKSIDMRDRGYGESESGQRSEDCFALADSFIFNNTTLEDLQIRLMDLIKDFGINDN